MKKFRIKNNVGNIKYLVSFHDGVKTHKDGSEFFDIHICKNKIQLKEFLNQLSKQGYTKL